MVSRVFYLKCCHREKITNQNSMRGVSNNEMKNIL